MLLDPTLGNLGQAKTQCSHQQLQIDHPYHLSCTSGQISSLTNFGLFPEYKSEYQSKFKFDYCGDPDKFEQLSFCTSEFILKDKIQAAFEEQCIGKKGCDLSLRQFVLLDKTPETPRQDIQCLSDQAQTYLKYTCSFSEEELREHQWIGLYVAISGVLCCLLYRSFVYWIRINLDIDLKVWDIETVTVADFSVQVDIPRKLWANWLEKQKSCEVSQSNFKDFLQQQIEEQVSKLPQVLKREKAGVEDQIKIASIQFAFDNRDLILKLKQRGSLLARGNIKNSQKLEEEILDLIDNQQEKFKRPVSAFVVFETQECQERCFANFQTERNSIGNIIWHESGQALEILDVKLEVMEAPEASDIIWENMGNCKHGIIKKTLMVWVIVIAILVAIVLFYIVLQKPVVDTNKKYPPLTMCDPLEEVHNNFEQFKSYALKDKENTMNYMGRGNYQCFCKRFSTYEDYFDKDSLCYQYQRDNQHSFAIFNLITVATIMLNFILRYLIIFLVQKIGIKTESQQTMQVCVMVFYAQLTNTGFMNILASANLENTPLSFIPLRKNYHDFTEDWYFDVGSAIVQTMFIQSLMPYANMISVLAENFFFKFIDTGCKNDRRTKAKTIQQYINSHAGPEMELHLQYSLIFVSVFVCFTYGLALPILFPITFFLMINQYISERILFAYFYRKPPIFGIKMNEGALAILRLAPILMFTFGYWQMGNRQIFFNEPSTKDNNADHQENSHSLFDFSDGLNHTAVFFVFFPIIILFREYLVILRKIAYKLKIFKQMPGISIDFKIEANINEKLGNYWNCIPGMSQLALFVQETYLRKNLKIQSMNDAQIEKMRTSSRQKKFISNEMNYDILENNRYVDQFFYQHLGQRIDNKSSDFVISSLRLGEDALQD